MRADHKKDTGKTAGGGKTQTSGVQEVVREKILRSRFGGTGWRLMS